MNGGQRERLFSKFIDMLSNMEVVEHGLSYYADKLYVTPKYLSTVCKQLSGRTALSWVNEKLIDSVRYHLEYTDLSAKEICHKLGFSSISFFGKYVKRHLGASPNEYRKRL
ncbi:MAG: helix-turn-helix domain-containing protein [Muribaculaceae bacterium]